MIVQYWPKDKPIPTGWKFSNSLSGNHGNYSILIEKIENKTSLNDTEERQ